MIKKYVKKPVVIEAMQLKNENLIEVLDFISFDPTKAIADYYIPIETKEGTMYATLGDYIIKEPFDKERMFYPCKPDIFEKTYEITEEQRTKDYFEEMKKEKCDNCGNIGFEFVEYQTNGVDEEVPVFSCNICSCKIS